jgi:hypothetical protein
MCEVKNMGNMTLAIPDTLQKEMKHFSEVRWSEVARKAIVNKLETLQLAEQLAKKSKLTEEDIRQFSKKLKADAAKRFLA